MVADIIEEMKAKIAGRTSAVLSPEETLELLDYIVGLRDEIVQLSVVPDVVPELVISNAIIEQPERYEALVETKLIEPEPEPAAMVLELELELEPIMLEPAVMAEVEVETVTSKPIRFARIRKFLEGS